MLKNLYITAIEAGSGKVLVLLGIMELLSKRLNRVGFFRPIVHAGQLEDNSIMLVRHRYDLAHIPYDYHYGLTHDEARHLAAEGQLDQVIQRVISKYKALEKFCDVIVCEGIDVYDMDPALVDNFDIQLSTHLSAPILLVANGQGKAVTEVIDTVRTERKTYLTGGCTIAATLINRVATALLPDLQQELPTVWTYPDPVFVIPEVPTLNQPTIAEVAAALNGRLIQGDPTQLNREVTGYKVAAMQLPNMLKRLKEGDLVITPGDRSDIIVGCLSASLAETYPRLSGILLTGGIELDPQISQLIAGSSRWTLPIVSFETDTYTTTTQINTVRSHITPGNERKIALTLGVFESHVDLKQLAARLAVTKSDRVTPLMFEYDLIERAKSDRQHIVLPEGTDERILKASDILMRRGVAQLTLLGNRQEIRDKIMAMGLDLDQVDIIDPMESDWHDEYANTYFELRQHKGIARDCAHDVMRDVSYFGTMMVYKGAADGMVSGAKHTTAHTIRPALEFIRPHEGCSIVSSVFLMCLDDRVLVYGDCAVNPNPNPQELADIAISSAETARIFGIEPLVAMLSYSTGESGQGADVEKVKEATRLVRHLRPDVQIEGPIQYDAAIDESVAQTKLPGSSVAGHATVFIFPDLNTGNNTYKAVQRSANAVAIGPVLQGLRKPVNDLSRGCTIADIVNTVAITAIQAQRSHLEEAKQPPSDVSQPSP